MKKRTPFVMAVVIGLLLSTVGPAYADGIIIPEPPRPCPGCPPPPPITEIPNLAIKYHRVKVTIEDQVATTRVDQVFVNESPWELEGTYIFPLPEGAAVSEFAMYVDGQRVEARVLEKDEARQIYEDIVRQRRDPALLEYVGRNAFQARVYPIPAHGQKRVELEYSEVLPMDQGLVKYLYPLNTEKFSSRPIEDVSVSIELHSKEAIKAIYSPSHDIAVDREGDYSARIGYEDYDVKPDRDFELYYSISEEDFGLNLVSYRQRGEDGFFLLLVAPRLEVDEREVIAKDVIFVLDTSGSMRGEKLEQAQDALEFVLDELNEEDRFNIITFSTGVRQYDDRLRPADERQEARRFVRNLTASGGTDINRALLEALDQVDAERPTILIFLTDGLATEGEIETDRILDNVDDAAPENVRIFVFGVGDDVNTILLDTMAQAHRGASAYVRPGEDIDEEVSAFYAKVSTPLLSDIELDFGGIRVEDTYPYPLPDLFVGTQLVLVGRYREGGDTTITLEGKVNDRRQSFEYEDVHFRDRDGDDGSTRLTTSFIPRLWATRKIGYLLSQIRLHGESRELVDEIVDLSVRYGIITPYTSFLVDETEDVLSEEGRDRVAEQRYQAMATATPAPAYGAGAVDKSEAESGLRDSQAVPMAPAAMPSGADRGGGGEVVPVREVVKYVSDKTFVLQEDVWMDTAYDVDKMATTRISFGSDNYFQLLADRPEWGKYFALGTHVIVVLEGTAYEVVEGEAPEVEVPPTTEPPPPRPVSIATPTVVSADSPTPLPAASSSSSQRGGLCGGASAAVLLPLVGLVIARRAR
jgi:Ca-activated chloride channel family protein